jgi:hypothetical protein
MTSPLKVSLDILEGVNDFHDEWLSIGVIESLLENFLDGLKKHPNEGRLRVALQEGILFCPKQRFEFLVELIKLLWLSSQHIFKFVYSVRGDKGHKVLLIDVRIWRLKSF